MKKIFVLVLFSMLFLLSKIALAPITYYDMWDYMCHDNWANEYMEGSHTMKNIVYNDSILISIKHTDGYPYEVRDLIGDQIYMSYESMKWPGEGYPGPLDPPGTDYELAGTYRFYLPGTFLWCPRYIANNDEWYTGNFRQCYVSACQKEKKDTFQM